jgi:serine/threonine-protein kinase
MPNAPASPDQLQSPISTSVLVGGRYEIEQEVGRGGAGIVYRARDQQLGTAVAVKFLRPEFATAVTSARFGQEIAFLARLNHTHLIPVLDSGDWGGVPFYVAPFLDGGTLRARLDRERQLSLADVVDIARQIGDALQYTHDAGVIHRDIKPENILFSGSGAALADFGIAYALERAATDRLTSSQLVVGTPAYMSPEQAAAERVLGPRSDQFSLACVIYEMLAGVTPFVAATNQAMIGQRLTHRPMPIRAHRPNVPEQVETAIARALSPVPADRYERVTDFCEALTAPARPGPGRRGAVPRSPKRLLTGAGVIIALGFAAWISQQRLIPPAAPPDLHRLAIAGFVGRGDRSTADFAAAVGDQLAIELGNVSAFAVLAQSSIPDCSAAQAACDSALRSWRTGAVVRGSIQRVGRTFEAAVQFVEPQWAGGVVRNERFSVSDSDTAAAGQDLARQIALAMRRWLGQQSRLLEIARSTNERRAQDLIIQADRARADGLAIGDFAAVEDLPTALSALDRADSIARIAQQIDPRSLEPRLLRGWINYDLGRFRSGQPRLNAWQRGLALSDSALLMDTSSARARELRGILRWSVLGERGLGTDTALARATEADLRGAISRDSTRATAWVYLSALLALEGHVGETERVGRRAIQLDAFLSVANDAIYRAFYNANMSRDSAGAAQWCAYGRQVAPGNWRFMQCKLVLMRRNALRAGAIAPLHPDSAWHLVAAMDSVDPPAKAAAAGRAYYAIFRRMAAAAISARAGDAARAEQEIGRAHRAVSGNAELQLDLLYDESILRHALGQDAHAADLVQRLINARPLERDLILRDPLFDWVKTASPSGAYPR